jgi:DNA-directed RNA polymerase omega subunit
MLTKTLATIQQHQELVGSRFELAQIIMRRTKQLMNGAPIKDGVNLGQLGSELNPKHRKEIPTHKYPKIALEELRSGKLKWHRDNKTQLPEVEQLIEVNPIVFGE